MTGLWDLAKYEPRTEVLTPGDTLPELFLNAVKARRQGLDAREEARHLARMDLDAPAARRARDQPWGWPSLGFEPGDTASILSNTVVEWVLADMGVLCAGGVSNGIYPTDSADQCEYLCTDSGTRVIFVEDEEQLDKVLEVRERLPRCSGSWSSTWKAWANSRTPQVIGLDALRERGRAHDQANPGEFERRAASRTPDDLAILVYTSGTTGRPKGAMHLHGALTWTVRQANIALPQVAGDERMCFLPLCHIAERMVGAFSSIYAGSVLNFVENPDTVPENVREISPTIFFAVPRVWEKFYSAVIIGVKESSRCSRRPTAGPSASAAHGRPGAGHKPVPGR
jgi:long-chain acyl-CoA synthetase